MLPVWYMPFDAQNPSPFTRPADQQPENKGRPELIQFEFEGVEHTVRLLSPRHSGNVLMEVDGVRRRMHVTFTADFDRDLGIPDTDLISFAKTTIDPSYGTLTDAEIQELLRQCGLGE